MAETPTPIAEIDHGPSKLDQFLENHQTKLILAAVAIALGVLGYVVWAGLDQSKQNEAGSKLIEADEIADYQDVIKQYPDSTAASSAMLLLANAQWQDSQPDTIQGLQDFLTQNPEHPAAHTASVSLGLKLLEQGKTSEAKEQLSSIADSHPDSYIAPLACIALGDIAKSEGQIDIAQNWYEKAKKDNDKNNVFIQMADTRLSIVRAQPPTKIKPTPPVPTVPPAPAVPNLPTPGQPSIVPTPTAPIPAAPPTTGINPIPTPQPELPTKDIPNNTPSKTPGAP